MKKLLLLLFIPSLCFGQMTRAEVMSKLNEWRSYEIERIQEIGSSRIITNNQIGDNISMINNGIYPYSETIYFFSGNEINSKLESVSTIYSHPDRSVISLYSNENRKRKASESQPTQYSHKKQPDIDENKYKVTLPILNKVFI